MPFHDRIKKKIMDKKTRLCIDYSKLNKIHNFWTIPDITPEYGSKAIRNSLK